MNSSRVAIVATKAELLNSRYYYLLWLAIRELKISRRKLIEEMSLLFQMDIQIIFPSGQPYPAPDFEELFPLWADRVISIYLKADKSGKRPRHICRRLDRLRLIDLYLRVHYPERALAISECV